MKRKKGEDMSNEAKPASGGVVKVEVSAEVEAVLRKQGEIEAAEHDLAKVVGAYVEQQRHEARLTASMPDMGQLNRDFDELLARHLTADADDEAVANYQRRVDTANADLARIGPELDVTRRMMGALERRGNELKEKVLALKQDKRRLVVAWLRAEAEAECERYVEAARTVDASYRRLRALDFMLRARGQQQSLHAHAKPLFVPRWRLPASDAERGHPHLDGALFAGDERFNTGPGNLALMADEKQRLAERYGVEFDE